MLPNDTNTLGNLLGGRLMHFIDLTGAMAAYRHARTYVVTAAMDHIDFIQPVHLGDLVTLKSSVNRAFNTSMEVGVKVWAENTQTGKVSHVASAYLVFVAVDEQGRRVRVPQLKPETPDEKRRYADALLRRATSRGRGSAPQAGESGPRRAERPNRPENRNRSESHLKNKTFIQKGAVKTNGAFTCHARAGRVAGRFEDHRCRFRQGRRGQNHGRRQPGHRALASWASAWA